MSVLNTLPVGATRPDGWVTQGAASLRSALPWAVCGCPSGAQPDGLELLPVTNIFQQWKTANPERRLQGGSGLAEAVFAEGMPPGGVTLFIQVSQVAKFISY